MRRIFGKVILKTLLLMKKLVLIALLGFWLPLAMFAQHTVQLGGYVFVPEQNLASGRAGSRGHVLRDLEYLGQPVNGYRNALVQLRELPTQAERAALARQGVELGDYLGGNAYWAQVRADCDPFRLRNGLLTSLVAVRPEWKLAIPLAASSDVACRVANNAAGSLSQLPAHARVGTDRVRVVVRYASNATPQLVSGVLGQLGASGVEVEENFRAGYAELPIAELRSLATYPWVLEVGLQPMPRELHNREGRIIGRASVLSNSASLGGRGLQGKGVRIGLWDASVPSHVDFGRRVHAQEYESYDKHGSHVLGTVLGAGLVNPDGRGTAPKAEAWTYNFGTGRNGLDEAHEMAQARERFGITLTQNSYGIALYRICRQLQEVDYSEFDLNLDMVAQQHPELTHVFSAGNDQQSCAPEIAELSGKAGYGTGSTRAKNVMLVGAVDGWGQMTNFSSWGPQDDGRLAPTVCAKGKGVLSTIPENSYGVDEGTSMAAPSVTGHAALLSERYAQLNGGAEMPSALVRAFIANTATDAGRPGPDFQYGYGIVNAERAVEALEQGWYTTGEAEVKGSYTRTVKVPKGSMGVRVMLAWTDPAVPKAYRYGESVLVNNLDLSLKAGAASYLPWVCNPHRDHLEDPASRGVDALNNMEQVTLNAQELAGVQELTITVAGYRVPTGKQPYALVWYFERDESRLIAPADGQLCTPGATMLVAVENMVAPYVVELSYDGGVNWQPYEKVIGERGQQLPYFPVRFPWDVPSTDRALVRVIDSRGRVAKSAHPFTVAPQVTGLKLQQGECGAEGWRLTWKKADGVQLGYVVLLANPDDGAEFEIIGETTPETTEFAIPADKLKGIERPVLSVAVKLGDGVYGKRALGIVPSYSVPTQLDPTALPFVETFTTTPSHYFRIEEGESIYHRWIYKTAGDLPAGSNLLALICDGTNEDFDRDDYFSAQNADNIARLRMCDLDLTAFPAGERVLLHITGGLTSGDTYDATAAHIRVKGGPDGTTLLADTRGVREQLGATYDQEWVYELEVGKKHQLVIEFAAPNNGSNLSVAKIAIERPVQAPQVHLLLVRAPEDAPQLGVETFRLLVENKSAVELKDLMIKAFCRNKWVNYSKVTLKPMEGKMVEVEMDLSTAKAEGEIIPIRFTCEVDPLRPEANGEEEYEVYNMGDIVLMPKTGFVSYGGRSIPVDPKVTHIVKERVLFTDNGGLLRPYGTGQLSTVKFLPSDPSMKVRVRFTKFSTVETKGILQVFTTQVTDELNTAGLRYRAYLTGEAVGANDPSVAYVSEAEDGGVTLHFQSASSEVAAGWEAVVDMVPGQNPLALTGVRAALQGDDTEGAVPVEVKILNRRATSMSNVTVGLRREFSEILEEVNPGEHWYPLRGKVTIPAAKPRKIEAYVEGDDTDASDNTQQSYAIYDRYCIPEQLPVADSLYIASVTAFGKSLSFNGVKTGQMAYVLQTPVELYKGEGKAEVEIAVKNRIPAGYSISLWVDWDNDGQFADGERQTVELPEGTKGSGIFTYDLNSLKGGLRRARVKVGPTASVASPCESLESGDALDFALELRNGLFTGHGDLALSDLNIGATGRNLSAEQPIEFTLTNRSNTAFDGVAKVRVLVDDRPALEEELDCGGEGVLAPYIGERKFTLGAKADLSQVGMHIVRVELLDNPVPSNNELIDTVYCIVPEQGGFYAIETKSLEAQGEQVEVNWVGKLLDAPECKEWTMELVFKAERPQFSELIRGHGFKLHTTYRVNGGIPDNAIAMVVGDNMIVNTPANAITPGRWHHLAVVVKGIDRTPYQRQCKITLYIDGKECQLEDDGGMDAPYFTWSGATRLLLGKVFDGQVKLFRVWESALWPRQIKSFAYVRNADGSLPNGCLAEFTFDEGPKNRYSLSGDSVALIVAKDPQRLNAVDSGMWQPVKGLIRRFNFEHQADYQQTGANAYTVTFDKGTDAASVRGQIFTAWPGVTLTYSGVEVTDATVFNFSRPVAIEAKANLFGHDMVQRVVLTYKEDLARECDLLSLTQEKGKNSGLEHDVVVSPVSQDCRIGVPSGSIDPTKVVLSFTLSEGATVTSFGKPVESGVSVLDLSTPRMLTVWAANRERKHYSVQIAQAQSIAWEQASAQFTYGDAPVAVRASTTSGLPITFTSSDASVATVADGMLRIGKPGSATLTATQPGGSVWAAAPEVSKSITVGRKPITVSVTPRAYPIDSSMALQYTYATLVNASDAWSMPDPRAKGCFTVKDSAGKVVELGTILPRGHYTVEADASRKYTTDLYEVTPLGGAFEVVKGNLFPFMVEVRDLANLNPLEGATVIVNGEAKQTDAKGMAVWYLKPLVQCSVRVLKDGYSPINETTWSGQGGAHEKYFLGAATLELKYTANAAQGWIAGNATQRVAPSSHGEAVLAVANPGYKFTQWSDGMQEAQRVDTLRSANLEVAAQFAPELYTLIYSVGEGGKLKSAPSTASQTVGYNASGVEVEVEPLNSDYYFAGWSDGVTTLKRTDTQVQRSMEVKALFGRYYTLPDANQFENGSLGDGWYTISMQDDNPWGVTKFAQSGLKPLYGSFAYCNSSVKGIASKTESYLYTPKYQIAGGSGSIIIKQKVRIKTLVDCALWLEMQTDNDPWVAIKAYPKDTEAEGESVYSSPVFVMPGKLAGKQTVQFRWKYMDSWAYAVELDNVSIRRANNETVRLAYVAEPAAGGKFQIVYENDTPDPLPSGAQEVKVGTQPDDIEAVPNEGYEFVRWDNGSTDPVIRYDDFGVYRGVTYRALFRETTKAVIAYQALPAAGGTFLVEGSATQAQEVAKGADAKEVVAVPNIGYRFQKWLDDGDTHPGRTMTNVQASTTLIAAFARVDAHRVTFTVVNIGGAPLQGVAIEVNGETLSTDNAGQATTSAQLEGDYSYTVRKEGYFTEKARISVSSLTHTVTVVLRRPERVTFWVKDANSGRPVEGAEIAAYGQTGKTDRNGELELQLPSGQHSYTIQHPDYQEAAGSIDVSDLGVTEVVELRRLYAVTFVVTAGGQPLAGAQVRIADEKRVTDTTGQVQIPLLGQHNYGYSVTRTGYTAVTGRITLGVDNQKVSVEMAREAFAITFQVTDGKSPVASAKIKVGDLAGSTDEKGIAVLKLPAGDHTYTVFAWHYSRVTGNLTASREMTEPVLLELGKTITFTVTDGTSPIKNARITLGEEVLKTDAAGKASTLLGAGSYQYKVAKGGYETKEGSLLMKDEDMAIAVVLTKRVTLVGDDSPLGSVQAMPNPFTDELVITEALGVERVTLFNALGNAVYRKTLEGQTRVSIPTGNLPAGTYLLRLEGSGKYRTLRLVKQ